MRDLSGVIERLRREKASSQARRSSPTILQLESVPTSSQAVYQTIKVDQEDSIRTELDEVHRMLNPAETIVGPDGKALTTVKLERHGGILFVNILYEFLKIFTVSLWVTH